MKYKLRSNPKKNPRRRYRRRARRNRPTMALAHYRRNVPARRNYRRRSYRHRAKVHHYRRRYRRNPPTFAGLKPLEIVYCGGAVVVAPIVENQIRPFLPLSLQTGRMGRWALKVGTAIVTWQGWRFLFGRHIGELTALVLGSNLLSDAVGEFAPSLTQGLLPAGNGQLRGVVRIPGGAGYRGGTFQRLGPAVRGPLDPTY